MKCYAILTCFEGQQAALFIPQHWTMYSFMANQFKTRLLELTPLCEQLESGKCYYDTMGEMKIYGAKLGNSYWAVACDTELSSEQQRTLTKNLLIYKNPPEEIAKHFADFADKTKDPKITQIQQELDETRTVLLKAFESLETRGEKISALLEKTEGLAQASFAFKEKAKDLNSCWPSFCVLI